MPTGGMNKDLDLSLVPKTDYIDALNLQHITNGGSTSYAIQSSKGNLLKWSIPAIVAQNKIYMVKMNVTAGTLVRQITFYNPNGSTLAVVNWTDSAVNVSLTFSSFIAFLNTALHGATPFQNYTVSLSGTYAIVTLTNVTGYDYVIKNTGANVTEVIVKQEGYSIDLVGDANIIGSYDLLGDLYVWSTPRTVLPSVLAVHITAATNAAPIAITTSGSHGLTTGDYVVISGVLGNTAANGAWQVTVTGVGSFTLNNSIGNGGYVSGGTITINSRGIGEIGVVVYDYNTNTATYTRLIRSINFNFTTLKQIDTYCEENNFERSIYWTDDYNIPRVFYYSGPFITDGGITVINPLGRYSYELLTEETKLILTNEMLGFVFTKQYVVGGGIISGDWRYAIRLLTKDFGATNWTELSNVVNVYKTNQNGVPDEICGDDANTVTPKINEFVVTNIPVGAFFYIELAAVHYINGAIEGFIVNRIPIVAATMTIQHTGNETGVTNLDVSTLGVVSFDIETAKNIDAIDNRLVLSNLTTSQRKDFSAWTKLWTHNLNRKTIPSIGSTLHNPKFGEYQDPVNVFNYMGLMHNDLYRMGARFELKASGNLTDVFWIDDILVNASNTNITVPDRRGTGLPDLNLTDNNDPALVYVPYVEFTGIDLDFLIDGVPARDLISSIHFERVERIPEVLATGVLALAIGGQTFTPNNFFYSVVSGTAYGEYPNISGELGTSSPPNAYPGGYFNTLDTVGTFYSPDLYSGNTVIDFISGDQFLDYRQPNILYHDFNRSSGGITFMSHFTQYNGNFGGGPTVSTINVSNTLNIIGPNKEVNFAGVAFSTVLLYNDTPTGTGIFQCRGGMLIQGAATLSSALYGLGYGQYKRPKAYSNTSDPNTSKYGNVQESIYEPTGSILNVDDTTTSPATQDVFGGDVFTQKGYYRHRSAADENSSNIGGGGGVSFYSQNVINVQMIRKYDTIPDWAFPSNTTLLTWLQNLDDTFTPPIYDSGYNIKNGVSSDIAFDPNLPDQSDLPTEIRYSDLKPQNAIVDNFRIFLPLNFLDLPLTFGEIMHHVNFNGELFTLQLRRVQRQYFNTRGTMNVSGGTSSEVLIGDGTVLSRPGQTITVIGTSHKWSVIKGKSAQGNDVLYWINTELKKVMRMGYDGTVSVADIHGLQSFFANSLTWVIGKDTPANAQGICGVWDDRYIAAIWTVRGIRSFPVWDNQTPYVVGDTVSFVPSVFSTFEKTGEIYIAILDSFDVQPDSDVTKWFLVPHQGTFVIDGTTYNASDYYNEYTIEFNEQKNKWTTFYSFLPKIYLKWTDTFFTPRPISDTGKVYLHREGSYCVWYDTQAVDGYITLIYNQGLNSSKMYLALWVYTLLVPSRIDLYTKKHQSFLLDTDFENNLDFFTAGIKNNVLTSSNGQINDEDTSKLFGEYIEIKLTFTNNVFQKMVDLVLKFFLQNRQSNK